MGEWKMILEILFTIIISFIVSVLTIAGFEYIEGKFTKSYKSIKDFIDEDDYNPWGQ